MDNNLEHSIKLLSNLYKKNKSDFFFLIFKDFKFKTVSIIACRMCMTIYINYN